MSVRHILQVYLLSMMSISRYDGEFVFVCGDSGSGKSTLIKLLLKELDPTDGTITVDGRNLTRIRHKQIPKYRRNVGVVFPGLQIIKG